MTKIPTVFAAQWNGRLHDLDAVAPLPARALAVLPCGDLLLECYDGIRRIEIGDWLIKDTEARLFWAVTDFEYQTLLAQRPGCLVDTTYNGETLQ